MDKKKSEGFIQCKASFESEIGRLTNEVAAKHQFLEEVKNPGPVIIDLPDDMTPQLLTEQIERQIAEKEQELAEVNELLVMLLGSE
jgi:hypothetical protein